MRTFAGLLITLLAFTVSVPDLRAHVTKHEAIELLLDQWKLDKAEKKIRKTFARDSSSFDYYFLMGRLTSKRSELENAWAYFIRCKEMNPAIDDIYGYLARIETRMGNYKEAIKLCDVVLSQHPDRADFLNEKSTACFEAGDTLQALVLLK